MQTNYNYCRVDECRFKYTHTTKSHKCGICSNYGHGQLECYNFAKIATLKDYYDDILNIADRCTIPNCKYSLFHNISAHYCKYCNDRGHDIHNCSKKTITVNCPICRTVNNFTLNQKKITGLSDICSVCLDKNVEIFFPSCGHVCVCYDCFIKTSKMQS